MAPEDQVRRTFDTLTARLHQEVTRHVEAAVADLRSEAAQLAGRPAPAGALISAMREIDLAASLTAVLDALTNCANRLAVHARVVVPLDPTAVSDGPDLQIPLAVGGTMVGLLLVDTSGTPAALRRERGELVEAIARYASERLTVITALRAAQLYSGRKGWSAAAPHPTIRERANEQESARRYARLLISEIKLYHEADVIAGRRDRDLAVRLAPEIARARALYDGRVSQDVRRGSDFFQAELVRTLANGDPSLLGHIPVPSA